MVSFLAALCSRVRFKSAEQYNEKRCEKSKAVKAILTIMPLSPQLAHCRQTVWLDKARLADDLARLIQITIIKAFLPCSGLFTKVIVLRLNITVRWL